MGSRKFLFALFLLLCSGIWAKEVTDTLESTKRDRVIVTYDITQNNGQVIVKFINANKKLGRSFKDRYKKLNEVVVLFFDKMGNYGDETEFLGLSPEPFMVPSGVSYKISRDGFFLLNDNQKLELELKSTESEELKIPIYIAHYEGKHRYKVFSRCEDLIIRLSKKKSVSTTDEAITQTVSQTVTTQEEVDGNLGEQEKEEVAINLINSIEEGLGASEISSSIQRNAERLNDLWPEIKDPHIKKQCEDILRRYDLAVNIKKDSEREQKKREQEKEKEEDAQKLISYAQSILMKDELSDYDLSDLRTTAQKMQMESSAIKNEALKAQMKQTSDACNEKIAQIEKKKEQCNIWMIVGGVFLVILLFVGNQTFQHFRNVKNQKSIMDMQQNVVKRAEDEAKRRARNMAHSQINRAQGEARGKARSAFNDGMGKMGKKRKGNKGITI